MCLTSARSMPCAIAAAREAWGVRDPPRRRMTPHPLCQPNSGQSQTDASGVCMAHTDPWLFDLGGKERRDVQWDQLVSRVKLLAQFGLVETCV
jgi:hypothetical protein